MPPKCAWKLQEEVESPFSQIFWEPIDRNAKDKSQIAVRATQACAESKIRLEAPETNYLVL
jgi:hypothetical protein